MEETLGGSSSGRVGILRPLKLREFRLLWIGMTVSLLGDGVYLVAIAWQVLELSSAPTALSIVGVAWTLPQVIFLLVGGVVSDRFDRRRVMIAADVGRALAIGAIGLLSITGAITLWHIYVLVAIYGTADAFFMPAFGAIVPDVAPRELLLEANSLDQFVRPLTLRLLGPAIGGVVVAVFGPGQALLLDGLSFVVSAVCVALMTPQPTTSAGANAGSMVNEIKDGFRFVRAHAWLWGTLAASGVGLLCFFGPWTVLVPFVVKTQLHAGADGLGMVLATGGVGAMLSSLAIGQRKLPRRHITLVYLSWSLVSFFMACFALTYSLWQAMFVSLAMFSLMTTGLVVWGTLMHRLVPSELLGRVSSLDWLVSTSLIPVSFALTGPIASAIGARATLAGAGIVGGLAVLGFLLLPGVRAIEKETAPAATAEIQPDADAGEVRDIEREPVVARVTDVERESVVARVVTSRRARRPSRSQFSLLPRWRRRGRHSY